MSCNGKEICGEAIKIEISEKISRNSSIVSEKNSPPSSDKSILKADYCKTPFKSAEAKLINSTPDWYYQETEEYIDSPDYDDNITPTKSKLRPCPIPRNKRGRKKIGEPAISPVIFIDHNTIAAYGSLFKIKRTSKNDGNSIIKCETCNRKFKKKSVRSHVISKLHQNKCS